MGDQAEQRFANRQTTISGGRVRRPPRGRVGNLLLDALPDHDYEELRNHLRLVNLRVGKTLIHTDDAITSAYFPTSGLLSLITLTPSGHTVEANQVGREGMVGLPAFLGVDRMPLEVLVQVPGKAVAMPVAELKHVTSRGGALSTLLKRYIYARMVETAQNTACNRLHSLEQRAARWLLETADRAERDEFRITHAFMSALLGVQRPRVSEAAAKLQRDGLIRYTRGRIRLLDRERLTAVACDCYIVVRDELRALVLAETGG